MGSSLESFAGRTMGRYFSPKKKNDVPFTSVKTLYRTYIKAKRSNSLIYPSSKLKSSHQSKDFLISCILPIALRLSLSKALGSGVIASSKRGSTNVRKEGKVLNVSGFTDFQPFAHFSLLIKGYLIPCL